MQESEQEAWLLALSRVYSAVFLDRSFPAFLGSLFPDSGGESFALDCEQELPDSSL